MNSLLKELKLEKFIRDYWLYPYMKLQAQKEQQMEKSANNKGGIFKLER